MTNIQNTFNQFLEQERRERILLDRKKTFVDRIDKRINDIRIEQQYLWSQIEDEIDNNPDAYVDAATGEVFVAFLPSEQEGMRVKISLKPTTTRVVIRDADAVPPELCRVKTEVDKKAVGSFLKTNQCNWAAIEQSPRAYGYKFIKE